MTKDQIKAELRRSACEDKCPSLGVKSFAWNEQLKYRDKEGGLELPIFFYDDQRTFFLLVAEAL